MDEEEAVLPFGLRVLKQWQEAAAVEFLDAGGYLCAGQSSECREQVDVGSELIDVLSLREHTLPSPESRDSCAALVR